MKVLLKVASLETFVSMAYILTNIIYTINEQWRQYAQKWFLLWHQHRGN